jgi:hypothetical protein
MFFLSLTLINSYRKKQTAKRIETDPAIQYNKGTVAKTATVLNMEFFIEV